MIKTIEEAIEFINDHTDIDVVFDDRLNFQSETKTKSLVLQDNDLDKLLTFLQQQEKIIDELKSELDKWKPKFKIGLYYYFNLTHHKKGEITLSALLDSFILDGELGKTYYFEPILDEYSDLIDDLEYECNEDGYFYLSESEIYATKEEAELSRKVVK